MKNQIFLTIISVFLTIASVANAQQFTVEKSEIFQPQTQNKKVLLLQDGSSGNQKIILFQTRLAVNTDGAPVSYHPKDLRGENKAINSICNAISVRRVSDNTKLKCSEAIPIFEQYRDNNWIVPTGFKISWQNVLAESTVNGKITPCIFQTGEYTGYFGSLTSLKNNLATNKRGECEQFNQLDQRYIPALVMPGGANPLKTFGAKQGDLVVAYNPQNQAIAFALIGDQGPEENLGEGSVALNMSLLKVTTQPKNYTEVRRLDTGNLEILIAVIPASDSFQRKTPFTKDNLAERVKNWHVKAGFSTSEKFVEMMKTFQCQLERN